MDHFVPSKHGKYFLHLTVISPLPVFTPEGTIGLPSVRLSVRPSVSLSVCLSVCLSAENLDPLIT